MKNKIAYFSVHILLILGFSALTTIYYLTPFFLFLAYLGFGFISQWAFNHFLTD